MENPLTIYLPLAIAAGLVVGAIFTYLWQARKSVSKSAYDSIITELHHANVELASRPSKVELSEKFVTRETFDLLSDKLREYESEDKKKSSQIMELSNKVTELQGKEDALYQQIQLFKTEIENLHEQSKEQFKNLATDILEEKRKLFVESNEAELKKVLDPLKTDLGNFQRVVQETRKEDIRDLTSLKAEISNLQKLNVTLHEDAQKLTSALKSDVKIQGNWGEDRLNMILEAEGLQKYIDFTVQATFRENDKQFRPDCVLRLPDQKHLVIDSKVSLTAYVNYFNAADPNEKALCLKQHVKSITDHIDLLAEKGYQALGELNTPDYVFMFMPIESALTLALNENSDLFDRASKKQIVLTTPSTFVATLKIVKVIWQKENRVKNVEKIFDECGKLYDRFVNFLEEMQKIENSLNTANTAFGNAMKCLSEGQKRGMTIMGRFERIKELEAKTTKSIPARFLANLVDDADDTDAKVLDDTILEGV